MFLNNPNIQLLKGIVENCYDMNFSSYDANLNLIDSTDTNDLTCHTILTLYQTLEDLHAMCQNASVPIIATNQLNLIWMAEAEHFNGQLHRIHIAGPAFMGTVSLKLLTTALENLQLSLHLKRQISNILNSLPLFSPAQTAKLGKLLHYCITGKRISYDDFKHLNTANQQINIFPASSATNADYQTNFLKEQALMKMFREGNLNLLEELEHLDFQDTTTLSDSERSQQDMKSTVISGITLYSRSAIEGGLPPEIGYPLASSYIKQLENCTSFSEISQVNGTAMVDFIQRVHRYRSMPDISTAVRSSCEYIRMHLESELKIEDIATHAGYSAYYLSRKFKKEMNMSISDYINQCKIDHAKLLLRSPQNEIQAISEKLHFCNPSYFSSMFHKITGLSPITYREQYCQINK